MPYEQVYADFLLHCQPALPPRPWRRFGMNADLWMAPEDEEATLAALRGKHSTKDLIRSGVASRDKNKKLNFGASFFGLLDKRILPLRAAPQCGPFDLLTEGGTCSGQLPIYAAVHDHRLAKTIAKRGFLCVTFSLQDLISLWVVGMPAALAWGLEEITSRKLKEFRSIFGLAGASHAAHAGQAPATSPSSPPSPAQEEEDTNPVQVPEVCDSSTALPDPDNAALDPPRLILVGWTSSQLSLQCPGDFDRVARSIATLANGIGIDLTGVSVWRPAAAEIRRIMYCLTNGNRKDVRQAILSSLDQSAKPLAPSASDKGSHGSLLQTRARLRKALRRPESNPAYRRRRLSEYQQSVDRTFVDPLLELAGGESDLDKRSRLGALAAVNRLLHPSVELFAAELEKQITRGGLHGDAEVLKTGELMKIFDLLFKFTKKEK